MMSAQQINSVNDEKSEYARKFREIPYTIWPGDIDNWKTGKNLPVPFPHLGDYIPDGFETDGEPLFIDTSGFGASDEPALTQDQLFDTLETGKAYAFVSVGQFQAYLQQYTRWGSSKCTK